MNLTAIPKDANFKTLDRKSEYNKKGEMTKSTVTLGKGKCITIFNQDGSYTETIIKPDGSKETLKVDANGKQIALVKTPPLDIKG